MKKALGQTVRDIKRGVNKNVLKVPSTEQKVMDATSNEPWGPHGSLLADIAHASRTYHEYQMIMSVIWKRINDTGKNWRHVYKALTVLEYLVAHGSERVIDEIREHTYQISTLSDFQYIDSSGRDQGNNVRKKSQSLVVLVNDKERIQEVRQKAASNRDKYRNASTGNLHRPGSAGGYGDRYDDERYGNRDYDRNGSRDDDRNGRYGDTYSQEGDRTSRDYDYRGRSSNTDEHHYGPRSRSADPYRDGYFEDDGQYSSRGSAAKADDRSQDGSTTRKGLERKYSEQNLGAPPSYEDDVSAARSPSYSERDGESTLASAPKASSPVAASPGHTAVGFPPPIPASPPAPVPSPPQVEAQAQHTNREVNGFDEFDPRGSFSATPAISNGVAPATPGGAEMNLLGSLSKSFNSNSLALVLADAPTATPEATAPANFDYGSTFAAASSASSFSNQPFDDPFGDGPFKAMPSSAISAQNPYMQAGSSDIQPPPINPQFVQQDMPTPNQDFDILADILPPSAPSSFVNTQPSYPVPAGHSFLHAGIPPQTNEPVSLLGPPLENNFPSQNGHPTVFPSQPSLPTSYSFQSTESAMQNSFPGQPLALTYPVQSNQPTQMSIHNQPMGFSSQMGFSQAPPAQPNPPNSNLYGTYNSQMTGGGHVVPPVSGGPFTQQTILTQPSSAVPPQPSQDKFETKSTVWADTLSRGLVNLNISGSKTNPLADIGVDFDAINRREKRMEKPTTTAAVTSTITMGKAMGSGSGIGRAGAGAIRPPTNPMVGSVGVPGAGYAINPQMGRGMNMPGNMGMGMNMPGSMGMGMGMNMPGSMGIGMNMPGSMGMGMDIGVGPGMQQQMGYPPGSTVPGGYNPMNGSGMSGQPNPYGNGYR